MEPAAPKRIIGGYSLLRLIGRGSMGEVYLARCFGSDQELAFKVLSAEVADQVSYRERFEDEIAALQDLEHPGIVRLIDAGEHAGRPWFAQEFVAGPSLEQALADFGGAVPEEQALAIAIQLAEALLQLEGRRLVHRDVRPANVLLDRFLENRDGQMRFPEGVVVKLADFGLVRVASDPRRTQVGICMGSPECMAPEQVLGHNDIDAHCDQYALGVLLYRMLTGQAPFAGKPLEVMAHHVSTPTPDPGDLIRSLSPTTRQLVCMAMAKRTVNRHRDFGTFIQRAHGALEEVRSRRAGSATGLLLRRPLVVQSTRFVRKDGAVPGTAGVHASNLTRRHRREAGIAVNKHERKLLEQYERQREGHELVPHGYRVLDRLVLASDDPARGSRRLQRSTGTSGRSLALSAARGDEDFSDINPLLQPDDEQPRQEPGTGTGRMRPPGT